MKYSLNHYKTISIILGGIFIALSGCTSYKEKGVFQELSLIYTSIAPTNLDLYREILPSNFAMPNKPTVAVFITDYSKVYPWPMTPYKEGGILIRCKYNGKDGWFVKDMPLTSWLAMKGGRHLGYPKYLVDDISLQKTTSGWLGKVNSNEKNKIQLEYTTGLSEKLSPSDQKFLINSASFATGNIFLLDPPNIGPTVQEITFRHAVQPKVKSKLGMVKITINPSDPWAAFFPKGIVTPGVFSHFTGGVYIENKEHH